MKTLKYAKMLEASGIERNKAEMHVQVLYEAIGEDMVTKQDLKQGIERVETTLRKEFREEIRKLEERMRTYVRSEIEKAEYRIVIKLGILMTTLLSLTLAAASVIF